MGANVRSVHLKQGEKETFDWAIVDTAVVLEQSGGRCASCRPFKALAFQTTSIKSSRHYDIIDCTLLEWETAAFALGLGATALQTFIRPPKTDAAPGDRTMLIMESYVFFYSRLVQ